MASCNDLTARIGALRARAEVVRQREAVYGLTAEKSEAALEAGRTLDKFAA